MRSGLVGEVELEEHRGAVRLHRALGDVTIVGGFDEERRPMGRQWSIPDDPPPFNSSWTQQQLDADLRPGGQGRGRAVTLVSGAGRFELIATQGGEAFGCNGK